MFEALLKSMGFDPITFKEQMTKALALVETFDRRLAAIEKALVIEKASPDDTAGN